MKGWKDYDFTPNFFEVDDGLEMHYVHENKGSEKDTILLLHGEPSWSYLYRKNDSAISSKWL